MTYRSVDKRRLSYLLGFGTQDGELKRFFDDNLKALVHRGARIRNAPHGNAARIRVITERLPAAAEEILRQWFKKNITVLDPLSPDELVSVFREHEAANTSPGEGEAPHLARSSLLHLFSDNPSDELVNFLKTPIPSGRAVSANVAADASIPDAAVGGAQSASHSALLRLIASAFEEGDLGDVLDELPDELASFVEGLLQIRKGKERSAQDALNALPPDSEEAKLLARSIKRMRSAGGTAPSQRGLVLSQPSEFKGDIDDARVNVFAYCTNAKPTATFLKPVGVVRYGRLETFSDDQRRQFFPEVGDVMAFSGAGRPRQPARGEVAIWDIEEHPTDKQTRCHVSKEAAELYSVVAVPVHSSDADSVRSYIKQSFEMGAVRQKNRLYELLDGVIIAPQNLRADLSRDDTYEQPFSRWSQLVGFAFEDQRLVAGPLPDADSTYDCAPISIAVRSMLRTLREQQKVHLTKAQVRDVIALFQEDDDIVSRQRMARIVDRLDAAEVEEAVLQDMLTFALEMPVLRQRIEDGVQERIDEKCRERDDLRGDIERLTAERASAESKLRSIEKAAKKQASETASLVKDAFDKAVSKGVETLVSARIFETLSGSVVRSTVNEQQAGKSEEDPKFEVIAGTDRDSVLQMLKACGLNRRFSTYLISIFAAANRVGLGLFLRGEFARQVVLSVSRLGRSVASFDVPIGLVGRTVEFSRVIASEKPLVILNANLSDFELYASEATDRMLARIAGLAGHHEFSLVGSLIESDLAIPLPMGTKRFSLTIDLAWAAYYELSGSEQAGELSLLEDDLKASELNQTLCTGLLEEIERLPSIEQGGVSNVIRRALGAVL